MRSFGTVLIVKKSATWKFFETPYLNVPGITCTISVNIEYNGANPETREWLPRKSEKRVLFATFGEPGNSVFETSRNLSL